MSDFFKQRAPMIKLLKAERSTIKKMLAKVESVRVFDRIDISNLVTSVRTLYEASDALSEAADDYAADSTAKVADGYLMMAHAYLASLSSVVFRYGLVLDADRPRAFTACVLFQGAIDYLDLILAIAEDEAASEVHS